MCPQLANRACVPREKEDGPDYKKTTTTWNVSTWAEKNGRDAEKVTLSE
jgi:hypothetical protein